MTAISPTRSTPGRPWRSSMSSGKAGGHTQCAQLLDQRLQQRSTDHLRGPLNLEASSSVRAHPQTFARGVAQRFLCAMQPTPRCPRAPHLAKPPYQCQTNGNTLSQGGAPPRSPSPHHGQHHLQGSPGAPGRLFWNPQTSRGASQGSMDRSTRCPGVLPSAEKLINPSSPYG